MTNDQPSHETPTPTTNSAPSSSTGPELSFTNDIEDTAHGRYILWSRDTVYRGELWVCDYTPSTRHEVVRIFDGAGKANAIVAARTHHRAALRRQAWEQYMRDNDPPATEPEAPYHPECRGCLHPGLDATCWCSHV